MLEFKRVDDGDNIDYHVHDAKGYYIGRIIHYPFTGEYLFQTPLKNSVIIDMTEMKSILKEVERLGERS